MDLGSGQSTRPHAVTVVDDLDDISSSRASHPFEVEDGFDELKANRPATLPKAQSFCRSRSPHASLSQQSPQGMTPKADEEAGFGFGFDRVESLGAASEASEEEAPNVLMYPLVYHERHAMGEVRSAPKPDPIQVVCTHPYALARNPNKEQKTT